MERFVRLELVLQHTDSGSVSGSVSGNVSGNVSDTVNSIVCRTVYIMSRAILCVELSVRAYN